MARKKSKEPLQQPSSAQQLSTLRQINHPTKLIMPSTAKTSTKIGAVGLSKAKITSTKALNDIAAKPISPKNRQQPNLLSKAQTAHVSHVKQKSGKNFITKSMQLTFGKKQHSSDPIPLGANRVIN